MKTHRRRTNHQGVQLARRRMSQARRSASRGLFVEQLEDRRLLSADYPFHSAWVPMDVTGDRVVSPVDELVISSQLGHGGSSELDTDAQPDGNAARIDTSQDSVLSPLDALLVNALSRGEGEPTHDVKFELELQDEFGVKIEPLMDGGIPVLDGDGDPIYRVYEGDYFRVQVFADDLRTPAALAPGVFQAVLDVAYNDPSLFSMNGTKPDAFSDLGQFQSFFKGSDYYSILQALPSAADWDVDHVLNEFDEILSLNDQYDPNNKLPTTADKLPVVYVTLKADATGKLTFQANPSDRTPPGSYVIMLPDDPYADRMVSVGLIDFGLPLHVTIERRVDPPSVFGSQNTLYYGDFNGDKYSDIAIATSQENNNGIAGDDDLAWYTMLGSASGLSVPAQWSATNGYAGEQFFVGDFDDDGKDDIISSTTRINGNGIPGDNDLAWYVIRSTGTGFESEVQVNKTFGLSSDKYYVSDFNGDEKADILISTTRVNANGKPDNDLAWYLMYSNGSIFANGGQINSSFGLDVDKYYASDFDGDKKGDMLISTTRINFNGLPDNDLAWYLMRSDGKIFLDGGRINDSFGVDSDKYYVADFDGKAFKVGGVDRYFDDMVVSTIRVNENGIAGDNDLAWYVMNSNGSTFLDGGKIVGPPNSYGRDVDLYFPFKLDIDTQEDLIMITSRETGNGDYNVYGMDSDGINYTAAGKKY